jgi:hypothetical protein
MERGDFGDEGAEQEFVGPQDLPGRPAFVVRASDVTG